VGAHDDPLGLGQRPGLVEDLVRDRDLAEVVQPAGHVRARDHLLVEPEPAGDRFGELGDLRAVVLPEPFAQAGGERQGLGHAHDV
jgi:hypothetical protein